MAFTRSSGLKVLKMIASEEGAIAALITAETVRNPMSAPTLQLSATSTDEMAPANRLMRYSRFCPTRSPSRPQAGPTTAPASVGPVKAHRITDELEPKSSAMVSRATDRRV